MRGEGGLDQSHDWDQLIEQAGPASLLVAIESRLGPALRSHLTADDIFQETLVRAWRARGDFSWKGRRAFRAWLLIVADRCIRDASDHFRAVKRGGREKIMSMHARHDAARGDAGTIFAGPVATTTPSRVVSYQEQAASIRAALDSLPEELRELIRLRIIEQRPIAVVAAQLGIGESAARHRLRKAADAYERAIASNHVLQVVAESGIDAARHVDSSASNAVEDNP